MAKATKPPKSKAPPLFKEPPAAAAPDSIEARTAALAMDYSRRLWIQMKEKDLAAAAHHLRNGTLAEHLTLVGQTAALAFLRLTRPGGISAKEADKEVADTHITIAADVDAIPKALEPETRELIATWEKGPGRPFAAPRNPEHAPTPDSV